MVAELTRCSHSFTFIHMPVLPMFEQLVLVFKDLHVAPRTGMFLVFDKHMRKILVFCFVANHVEFRLLAVCFIGVFLHAVRANVQFAFVEYMKNEPLERRKSFFTSITFPLIFRRRKMHGIFV